ncbi:hypothetical protein JXB02_05540 [Candidatus Woesearchaeota archaeon]|nr:hypothetical protein [Candidatus Woesearchaeota archaeon]
MRRSRFLPALLTLLLLAPSAFAHHAGLVVTFPTGDTDVWCIAFEGSQSAYTLLQRTEYRISAQGSGDLVFIGALEGIANRDLDSWAFWTGEGDGGWELANVGLGGYDVSDGDVLGLSYATFDLSTFEAAPAPEEISFEEACRLRLTNADVSVDHDEASGVDEFGGTIDEVSPGSIVNFDLTFENTYTDDDRIAIEDVSCDLVAYGIDDRDDLEEDSGRVDIDEDSDEEVTISIDVPPEVDEGIYDVSIRCEGSDGDISRMYLIPIRYRIQVEKESHDVRFLSASLQPASARCGERSAALFTLLNYGTKDEDLDIEVNSRDLSVEVSDTDEIEAYSGDIELTRSYGFSIPAGTPSGTYPVEIEVFYDDGDESVTRKLSLDVTCGSGSSGEEKEEEGAAEEPPAEEATKETTGGMKATGGLVIDPSKGEIFVAQPPQQETRAPAGGGSGATVLGYPLEAVALVGAVSIFVLLMVVLVVGAMVRK